MKSLVYVADIEGPEDKLLAKLSHKDWYLPVLEKMGSSRRRQEWLMVRVVLKNLLGEEKEICYRSDGSPFFSDRSYFLGISHSYDKVAVILNKEHKVAIDIEKISDRALKIKDKFLIKKEYAGMESKLFYVDLTLLWSVKETAYKMMGIREVDFRKDLRLTGTVVSPSREEVLLLEVTETKTPLREKFLIRTDFTHKGYILTYTEVDLHI